MINAIMVNIHLINQLVLLLQSFSIIFLYISIDNFLRQKGLKLISYLYQNKLH